MIKHFITLSILTIVFASCQKEATDKTAALQSIQNGTNKSTTAAVQVQENSTFNVIDNGDGTFTATLQPDASNGQDVHVEKVYGGQNANENFNFDPELDMTAWTVNGNPIFLRSYLRFVDLAKIPSTSTILSATLYLYGLNSSRPNPQGNSIYPGSPYNQYQSNRCIIEPVGGPWDENTLTWNTQPKVKSEWGQVTIPKSTSQWNYDVVLDDVKGMVARAVKYPLKDYGVRISLADEHTYRNLMFGSSEASDPTRRPKLVVTYQ